MKIFVLEDDLNRIEWFQKKFGATHSLFMAKSVEEGQKVALENGPFDTMFLDHDLAPQHYLDFDPSVQEGDFIAENIPDGHDFVQWLINNKKVIHRYTQIIIHSANPIGSKRMCDTINGSSLDVFPERIPFIQLIKVL